MKEQLYVVRLGNSERLERLLRYALEGREVAFLPLDVLAKAIDAANPDEGVKAWSDPVTLEKLYRL